MSTIWIVEGSTGEYSDHQEWPVKAFRDKVKAERLVVEAQARAKEIETFKKGMDWGDLFSLDERKDPRTVNEFDPDMKSDYTGTHYTCYPIELDES